jgi:energy-converting hydrogenase B subunit D
MMILGIGVLLLIAVTAFCVVRTHDTTAQVMALTFYGLLLAMMFFIFQAPDVAISQITVGAIALPLIIMLAISRMRVRDALRADREDAP